jgi:hypothetical protein
MRRKEVLKEFCVRGTEARLEGFLGLAKVAPDVSGLVRAMERTAADAKESENTGRSFVASSEAALLAGGSGGGSHRPADWLSWEVMRRK